MAGRWHGGVAAVGQGPTGSVTAGTGAAGSSAVGLPSSAGRYPRRDTSVSSLNGGAGTLREPLAGDELWQDATLSAPDAVPRQKLGSILAPVLSISR